MSNLINDLSTSSIERRPRKRQCHELCFSLSLHKNFGTVHQWLKMCKCYDAAPASFYPTRLINLENVKALISAYGQYTIYERGAKETINLVETAEWKKPDPIRATYGASNMHYVTLSHCWGGEVKPQLLKESLEDFKRGILIGSLPRTFQDAIYFAASLDTVGYIWIDSLCIIQNDERDWTKESANMHLVYSNSFLNLSATAALNSHGGFFRDCGFELLQEEEVTLDIEGLPRTYDEQAVPKCLHDRSRFFKRQCIVVDASFWKHQVDEGPVNMRGWVLQERLMSPRVVHFCHDQVGWECACRDAPKATTSCGTHPSTISAGSLKDKSIVEGIKRRLLDAQAPIACSPFDLWAAVVNAYTRTTVSFPRDKLIALSGLAEITSKETKCAYVAGLWQTNLVNQLLWYIEPAFDKRHRSFSNPATFKTEYCAPSWSWAAINATGHGITYAKTARQRPFVTIDDTHVTTLQDFEFGAVLSARITLRGKLRKARLVSIPNNRFAWHLVDCGHLDAERHQDVYLDCPLRDDDCIDKPDTHVYVLPVADNVQNSGTTTDLHLVCLILRAGEQMGTFKRIGMTKLSPFMDRKACAKVDIDGRDLEYRILKTSSDDTMLPHAGYDERTGAHRLHLV
jgi:hypothetical protein